MDAITSAGVRLQSHLLATKASAEKCNQRGKHGASCPGAAKTSDRGSRIERPVAQGCRAERHAPLDDLAAEQTTDRRRNHTAGPIVIRAGLRAAGEAPADDPADQMKCQAKEIHTLSPDRARRAV